MTVRRYRIVNAIVIECMIGCRLTIVPFFSRTILQQTTTNHNWIRERFNAAGPIGKDTAVSSLPRGASQELIDKTIARLKMERTQVRSIMKDEVEKLMRMGADITQMTYMDTSSMLPTTCSTAKNMRESYQEDGGLMNIKRLHWIFHELPYGVHQDVLAHRQTHMDMVVARVEHRMNITWAPRKEQETKNHRNCLEHTYSKLLNEKKQTIIREEGTNHKRKPLVRHPKTFAASRNATNFKKGKTQFYWVSKMEGEHWVSSEFTAWRL